MKHTIQGMTYEFKDLKALLAQASPLRAADELASIAAKDQTHRAAAQLCLSNLPLKTILNTPIIDDNVTELIQNQHNKSQFTEFSSFTVGELREWILHPENVGRLSILASALTPEMVSAVSKIMRNQELIYVASKIEVKTAFRNTIGLKGRLSTRLQPNHPTDNEKGILASILDGLLLASGDATIGINPALDSPKNVQNLLYQLNHLIHEMNIPTQSCVLTHVTTQIDLLKKKIPIDLVFQSIGGTQKTNESFGVELSMLQEAMVLAQTQKRGTIGTNVMYFETGQGSSLSANSHFGIDAQTCEVRAYAVAREYKPLLVNSVVGFIGPEYLSDGKQIIRAGLEDHFCGKIMGLPMGVDICYTNHSFADQNDMDVLLTLLGTAGCNYIMGVPGADDIMLNYQSTSFHDALYLRNLLGLKPSPEFEAWLYAQNIFLPNQPMIPTFSLSHQLKEISNGLE